ncbi:hypothetical protein ACSBPU_05570 [Parapusillimonas sp. JC17]|uniref:hypothetical protein n=1 Tax=Parapusillimonas sp. JC17 TaxID=3445768 RepID=UPI003FA12B3E
MSGLYPISGSKLYIGGRVTAKGTVTAADFAGATWMEVGGWANAGAVGDTQNVGEQDLINERRTRKFKTTVNGGTMDNQFVPMALDPGQIKFKEAIADCNPYQFKIEWGADCMPEGPVTISVAEPGVVTWQGHGLVAGQPVVFASTGTLPTGLTAGTVYYVIAAGLTSDAFSVAATPGGAGIATTAAGSGTHTASAPPAGMTDMFYGLALPGARQGGGATSAHLRNWSIAVDSNIVEV